MNNLLEAMAKARSRLSWNDRLTHWERPASDSEEQQIERAANMVRAALSSNNLLNNEGVTIHAQGSYYNNTNVRLESDMDLRATHPCIMLEYDTNVDVVSAKTVLGIYDTGRTCNDIARDIRSALIFELIQKFGAANIDASGKKAIRIKKQPGTRADVDIAPTFNYSWVMWDVYSKTYVVEDGITILATDGTWTHNFPEQHHANGIAKRARTKHRFKRNVRMLKRLRDELVSNYLLRPKQVPSFLIESLTYAVDDGYFLIDSDDQYYRILRILYRMRELLSDPNWVENATEINGIKYLFRPAQPWSIDDTKAFVLAAINRLEA